MAYIGNTPALQYITHAKQTFTADSATVAFTLSQSVANENELEVFVNNVRQEPGSGKAYTASGTTLTMTEAPNTGDSFYCIYQGKATQTVTPGASTVTNAMLSGSIANAKLANSSITLNSSAVSLGGSHSIVNTPAFCAYLSTGQSISNNTFVTVVYNAELFDTNNDYDTSTGIFTPTEAGKYFFTVKNRFEVSGDISSNQIRIEKNSDTSSLTLPNVIYSNIKSENYDTHSVSGILEANGSSDTFRVRVAQNSGGSVNVSASFGSFFSGYKLIT
tara:strand:- start:1258 stop:2082 length:825 start_codon:yes stop_codon:yes gene_type:complete